MPRAYSDDVPSPNNAEEFNQYLRDNNEVVLENNCWILIENSYIENQLVLFCKENMKTFSSLTPMATKELLKIMDMFNDKHIYINAHKDKSVPDRLHIHIKNND